MTSIKTIIKSLGLLTGMVLASEVWASCPLVIQSNRVINTTVELKKLNINTDTGKPIYFCIADDTDKQMQIQILEHDLVNSIQLDNGMANVPFSDGSATASLGVSSVNLTGGVIPTSTLKSISRTYSYPIQNGVFYFFQHFEPASLSDRVKFCAEQSHPKIIEQLRNSVQQVFHFENAGSVQWLNNSNQGTTIATAKVGIKNNQGAILPANFTLSTKQRALYSASLGSAPRKHLFCFVGVGVDVSFDTSDPNFRNSGDFDVKLKVLFEPNFSYKEEFNVDY